LEEKKGMDLFTHPMFYFSYKFANFYSNRNLLFHYAQSRLELSKRFSDFERSPNVFIHNSEFNKPKGKRDGLRLTRNRKRIFFTIMY